MITRIAQKEFTEMRRDGRFRIASAIVLILLFAALMTGWQNYRRISEQQATARAFDEQQWLEQGERNPHSAAHFGKYAFKPNSPLSFLDQGLNSYLGIAVWLEAHYQDPFRYRPAEDATAVQRFGELTVAVMLQFLIPLLIILLTFSAFSGERESGTLRQLLSVGVDRKTLALGKALGIGGALLLLLIPAAIGGSLALAFAASGTSADGLTASFGRFLVFVLTYSLYFILFTAISLAASAYFKTARLTLLMLFAFWIFNCLLVPRAVVDAAQEVYPAPSYIEFWNNVNNDKKQGIDGHNPADSRTEEAKKQLLAQYKVEKMEDLPINFEGWSLQQGEEYGNQVFDKRYGELWEIFNRQNNFSDVGAIFAPLIAVRSVSMSMAGTDFSHHQRFAIAAESYRRVLNKMMNEDYMIHGAGKKIYNADETLWKQAPQFEYRLPPTAWALQTQILPLSILLLWTLGAMGLAWFAVSRLKAD